MKIKNTYAGKLPSLNRFFSTGIKSLLFIVALLFSQASLALSLQEAKAQGLVGEQLTGYLGAVKSSGAVNALVKKTNAKRKKHYMDIAKRNNTSLDSVEKLAGKKAIAKTAKGQFINAGNGWARK